jgi:hypothetical protein
MAPTDAQCPDVPDLERIREAARAWLAHIGDLDHSPVIVPFGDPEGTEKRSRYELAKVLRTELFEPKRHGPIYVWSGEHPLEGQLQHWGGSDIWRCDDHPDWQGEAYGSWESYWKFVSTDTHRIEKFEDDVRREWEDESMEAHAAIHDIEIG